MYLYQNHGSSWLGGHYDADGTWRTHQAFDTQADAEAWAVGMNGQVELIATPTSQHVYHHNVATEPAPATIAVTEGISASGKSTWEIVVRDAKSPEEANVLVSRTRLLLDASRNQLVTDTEALDEIMAAVNGKEWSPDVFDTVVDIVRSTGREVADMEPPF